MFPIPRCCCKFKQTYLEYLSHPYPKNQEGIEPASFYQTSDKPAATNGSNGSHPLQTLLLFSIYRPEQICESDFGSSNCTGNQSFLNLTVTRNHASFYFPHSSYEIVTINFRPLTTLDWTGPTKGGILSIPLPQSHNNTHNPHIADQKLTAASFSTPLLQTLYNNCMLSLKDTWGTGFPREVSW